MSETYYEIKKLVLSYNQGDKILSERDLAKKFSVARATVSSVLTRLENEGYIWRKLKSGWFVSPPKFIYSPLKPYTYDSSCKEQGFDSAVELISVSNDVPHDIMVKFDEQNIICITRVKYLSNRPVMVEKTFIPSVIVPDIKNNDLSQSLTLLFNNKYNIETNSIDFDIQTATIETDHTEYFSCSQGLPAITVQRDMYNDNKLIYIDYEIWRFDAIKMNFSNQNN